MEAISLPRGNLEDAEAVGRICHDAFADISAAHNFPKDMPSPEIAAGFLSGMLVHSGISTAPIWGAEILSRGPVELMGQGPLQGCTPERE
jgi:hypothetical protein